MRWLALVVALLIVSGCAPDAYKRVEMGMENAFENTAEPHKATDEATHILPAFRAGEERGHMSFGELAADMGAGWNLGNTMDAVRPVRGTPSQHETAWRNPVTTPEMIRLLADSGFGTLRIPITWEQHLGPAPDYIIAPEWLGRVQEVVDYGFDCGLYVIINMHHEDWHYPSYQNHAEAEARLTAVWAQIAERFRNYSEKLIFESLNEPRTKGTPHEWTGGDAEARDIINQWNAAFVRTIRADGGNNATRWLMVPTIAASSEDVALREFVLPDDDRVIVSVHSYTPYDFALNTQAMDDVDFDSANPHHIRDIDALFARLDTHFISKGVPVIMGETGCINKENPEARVNWTRYYTGVAAKYGVPCIWWDNGVRLALDGGEGFGIMDRRNADWWFPEIVEAFVNP